MRNTIFGLVSALALTSALVSAPAHARNVDEGEYVYAVKYVCGSVLPRHAGYKGIPGNSDSENGRSAPYYPYLVPGWYSTVVNVHNPNEATISMEYETNTTHGERGDSYKPVEGGEDTWPAEVALEYDCTDFYNWNHYEYRDGDFDYFLKGIYYIKSTYPIDVIAVYTAAPFILDGELCPRGDSDCTPGFSNGGWAGGWTRGVSTMQVLPILGRKIGGGDGIVKEERY